MKVYLERPAKILVPARQRIMYLPNYIMRYVSENHLSSEFRTDNILISTNTLNERKSLMLRLKELGAKFVVKK